MQLFNKIHLQKNQKGFSVALLLGAIVLIGVIGYLGSTILSTIVGGNQRTNLVLQSGQTLTQASYILTTETTRNGSGIPVALAFLSATPSPTGGGIIPSTSAAPKIDAYGTNLGYCVNTASAQVDPVFAVISAGPNKIFNTTCAQALVGTVIGDDKVIAKSVINVLQGVGGTVYYGDPVATVADLANLSIASIKAGQMRTVLADGSVYVNKTGVIGAAAWTVISTGIGGSGGGTGVASPSCPANTSDPANIGICIDTTDKNDTWNNATNDCSTRKMILPDTSIMALLIKNYAVIGLTNNYYHTSSFAGNESSVFIVNPVTNTYGGSNKNSPYYYRCVLTNPATLINGANGIFLSCTDTRFGLPSQYGNAFNLGATCVQNGYVVAYKAGLWCADPAFKSGTYAIGKTCNGKNGYVLKYAGLNSGTPMFMTDNITSNVTYEASKNYCNVLAMSLPTTSQASLTRSLWGPFLQARDGGGGIWLVESLYLQMQYTGNVYTSGAGAQSTYYCYSDS